MNAQEAQEFILEHDQALPPISEPARRLREKLLSESGWRAGIDGDVPGVFSRKDAGHRCLWSCTWSTAGGPVRPEHGWPLECMTIAELAAEASDVCNRMASLPDVANRLLPLYLQYRETDNPKLVPGFIPFLRKLRPLYGDFVWQPDAPQIGARNSPLMFLSLRPSWWGKADYFQHPTVSLNA